MVARMPGLVFVHGAWHNHETWDHVLPHLHDRGIVTTVFDMPGAGVNARLPASYIVRPLDRQAFAAEPSPNAGVTQDERTDFVIGKVRETAEKCGGKVAIAGHSLGGATVSHVVERVPELISAAVYIGAFLLPPGMPPVAMIRDDSMKEALVPGLFFADPPAIGAMRVDFRSEDPDYRARLREAYAGDVGEEMFGKAIAHFHCDEPAQVTLVPSSVTRERFGTVPRHYIHCTQDRAVTPAGQKKMIALTDAAMGNATRVHVMATSHSPFDADPKGLADILAGIAQA
ncbi:alpha/beta fold hydrolase [Polymorphum gilvum]|uniref:Alpha/beta hydrolase fold protein n=1 Tax=Polymorphum gilvum (strain LMG 25793 / CGMCC 1.9160 / SL003B-26A1) TaxID=991905 RepID=F2IWB5_POLGS|nr:alpha/beta hydrolase [Polymorphum gilvum]ADZ71500.1 Alpha/beta hydrolase fold protein [Polymorphum gilvum SL003B-26A1]